jgi:hypothetical protein
MSSKSYETAALRGHSKGLQRSQPCGGMVPTGERSAHQLSRRQSCLSRVVLRRSGFGLRPRLSGSIPTRAHHFQIAESNNRNRQPTSLIEPRAFTAHIATSRRTLCSSTFQRLFARRQGYARTRGLRLSMGVLGLDPRPTPSCKLGGRPMGRSPAVARRGDAHLCRQCDLHDRGADRRGGRGARAGLPSYGAALEPALRAWFDPVFRNGAIRSQIAKVNITK